MAHLDYRDERREARLARLPRLGVVGISQEARGFVSRLTEAGYEVSLYEDKAYIADARVRRVVLPADAAEDADVVLLNAQDETLADELLFDHGGIGETLRTGGVVLDASCWSSATGLMRSARLAEFGIARVELALGDALAVDRPGRVVAHVAGSANVVAKVWTLICLLADEVIFVGPVGTALTGRSIGDEVEMTRRQTGGAAIAPIERAAAGRPASA